MIPYTVTIGGTDFSSAIQTYGYSTEYNPVVGSKITTMDGKDHVSFVRWKGKLHMTVNPLENDDMAALVAAIQSYGAVEITYYCLQRNENVTAWMVPTALTAALVLHNASRDLIGDMKLDFEEL